MPVGRLDGVQTRLQQLIEATNIVAAPLSQFYGSLTDEQKARVNQFDETRQQQTPETAGQADLAELRGPQTGTAFLGTALAREASTQTQCDNVSGCEEGT